MKPLVIYHDNCVDGFGAAFAAWLKFGDRADYLPLQYNKTLEHYGDAIGDVIDTTVYILDFSLPKVIMEELFNRAEKVVWLDHHKTAFEMWCFGEYKYWAIIKPREVIILNNDKSGAMLAWEHFHPDEKVPMFIQHIDDYDRWQFKMPDTKKFNIALKSYTPWSFDLWEHLFSCQDILSYEKMISEGEAILRAHNQNVQATVKNATTNCNINCVLYDTPRNGFAANCPPHLASDVGHTLANMSGTFGLVWYINKDGQCICSLRSNGDYDVSAIAKSFGGGGHKNAAGFTIDISTLLSWLK